MKNIGRIPNAQKWTDERVMMHLIEIRHDSYQEDVSYLGEAIVRQGLYLQIWSYWRKVFADNDYIMEEMLIIESIFESRLYKAALEKKVSSRLAIIGLKNNHGWHENPKPEKEETEEQVQLAGKQPEESLAEATGEEIIKPEVQKTDPEKYLQYWRENRPGADDPTRPVQYWPDPQTAEVLSIEDRPGNLQRRSG